MTRSMPSHLAFAAFQMLIPFTQAYVMWCALMKSSHHDEGGVDGDQVDALPLCDLPGGAHPPKPVKNKTHVRRSHPFKSARGV